MRELSQRLQKNIRKLKGWLKTSNITAYRIYDWDIPGYPFFIDVYGPCFVVYDKTDDRDQDRHQEMCEEIIEFLTNNLGCPKNQIIWKVREKQKGRNQYQKVKSEKRIYEVHEGPRKYRVNLTDYLDTGLFLDHRPLRNQFQKYNQESVLNLFSYTCSVGVAAALGGALTTNVDLSKTYLDWGKDNYYLNDIDVSQHEFIQENVLDWVQKGSSLFSTIFLDPPTFSNSKRMSQNSFEVGRDQNQLLESCLRRLKDGGKLYFSNNSSQFRLSAELQSQVHKDLTLKSHPQDFHNKKTHRCYLFIK